MKVIETIMAFLERRRKLRLRERIFMALMKGDSPIQIEQLGEIIDEVMASIEGSNQ
jgi:hypothetical protein